MNKKKIIFSSINYQHDGIGILFSLLPRLVFIMTVIGVALVISGLTALGVGLVAVWAKFCSESCDATKLLAYIRRTNEEKTSLMKTDYGAAYQVSSN